MLYDPWGNLQLFAEGEAPAADGGSQAAAAPAETADTAPETVVPAGDDGQQRLRELGVPEDVLRKSASRRARRKAETAPAVQKPAPVVQQSAAAPEEHPEPVKDQKAEPKTYTEEQLQDIIRKRVKENKGDGSEAAETLRKLGPTLELLAKSRNLDWDPEHPNYDGLYEDVHQDTAMYEPYALQWGCTPEEAKERIDQDIMFQNHFATLDKQAAEMAQKYPGFDLKAEMQNPTFMRMTTPGGGLSLEDAYWAVHRTELLESRDRSIREDMKNKVTQSIQSGSRRPIEAGTSSQAPTQTHFKYSDMSREQRMAYKEEIQRRMARGETVYPGMR